MKKQLTLVLALLIIICCSYCYYSYSKTKNKEKLIHDIEILQKDISKFESKIDETKKSVLMKYYLDSIISNIYSDRINEDSVRLQITKFKEYVTNRIKQDSIYNVAESKRIQLLELKWSEYKTHPDSIMIYGLINPKLGKYSFQLKGKFKDNAYCPNQIIIRNSQKVIQTISLKQFDFELTDLDNTFEFIDLNFDKYLDFRILYSMGATGNCWYGNWIYNININRFDFNEVLNSFSAIVSDTVRKLLYTYERCGIDWQKGVILKPLKNYKFDTVRAIFFQYYNDGGVYEFHDKINGKWKLVKKIKELNTQLQNEYYKDSIFMSNLPQ